MPEIDQQKVGSESAQDVHSDEDDGNVVGQRLRVMRTRCRMSIRELAGVAGVTAGIISCIERGKNSPSISTLTKILLALGTDLQTFFGGSGDIEQGAVFRREKMGSVSDKERNYAIIFPKRDDIKVEMLDEHLDPRGPRPEFEALEVDVAGYLISGSLRLEIEGDENETLRPGDAFYITKGTVHRGYAVGEKPARLITVATPAKY